VPFVLAMFVTVEALRLSGVTTAVGEFFQRIGSGGSVANVFTYGISSALAANALNNIPMTVAFASVMRALEGTGLLAAALATTIGSNLGALFTPVGALAGIMWMSILRDKEQHVTFAEFVKFGLLIAPAGLCAALGVLALEMAVF
jgi:arsenical pump membrane protein